MAARPNQLGRGAASPRARARGCAIAASMLIGACASQGKKARASSNCSGASRNLWPKADSLPRRVIGHLPIQHLLLREHTLLVHIARTAGTLLCPPAQAESLPLAGGPHERPTTDARAAKAPTKDLHKPHRGEGERDDHATDQTRCDLTTQTALRSDIASNARARSATRRKPSATRPVQGGPAHAANNRTATGRNIARRHCETDTGPTTRLPKRAAKLCRKRPLKGSALQSLDKGGPRGAPVGGPFVEVALLHRPGAPRGYSPGRRTSAAATLWRGGAPESSPM